MLALVLGLTSAHATDVLFVGNSYVLSNDLPTAVAEVFASAEMSATTGRLAAGGLRLSDHLARASDPASPWFEKLVTEAAQREWVVLQDQSQIPGFPQTQVDWTRSRDAAVGLNELVADAGAETMLFITWGRRDGDATNPARYPDFSAMQALLTEGYLAYGAASRTAERPVWYAPVGQAWAKIHDDVLAAGGVPAARDTLFYRLYSDDGSHPSALGTQLTAYVFYASVTGQTPVGLPAPRGIADADAAALQLAAEAAVFDETDVFVFPWEVTAVDDTGQADTGPTDPGVTDDPPADDGEDEDEEPAGRQEAEKHESNGCATAPAYPSGGWLLLGLSLLGRRARGSQDG